METETAYFGAGCFWGVELEFSKVTGVLKTRVGYMGGSMKNPTYEDVCTDETGHVEVVKIEFNPKKVSYNKLLDIFWKSHDPTQLNRQGPDFGTQYRSVIFYTNNGQKKTASESLKEQQKNFSKKIVTVIVKAEKFYEAEEYHQKYLEKRGKNVC